MYFSQTSVGFFDSILQEEQAKAGTTSRRERRELSKTEAEPTQKSQMPSVLLATCIRSAQVMGIRRQGVEA